MSEDRDERLLNAALGEGAPGPLSAEDRKEASRLRAAFLSLAAEAAPETPPPALRAKILSSLPPRSPSPVRLWLGLAAVPVLAALGWFFARPSIELSAARLGIVSGTVTINGRPASTGQEVPPNASLDTGPDGRAELILGRTAAVRLKTASRLFWKGSPKEFFLRLERGGALSRVRSGSRFSLSTPIAVAAVRGTTFYVESVSPDKTYVCMCEGRLTLTAQGSSQDLATDHHNALWAGQASDNGPFSPAGMRDHGDDLGPLTLPE